MKNFPNGSGTQVKIKIPPTYKDVATGEQRDIHFPGEYGALRQFPSLAHSPLFGKTEVSLNDTVLPIGKNFVHVEHTPLASVKFDWGNADLYATKAEKPLGYGENNLHILSNGLWQFSGNIKKDPMDSWGPAIPRTFHLDIHPQVSPEEAGYPFDLNRQQFSPTTKEDLNSIFHYVSLLYQQKSLGQEAQNYGQLQYLTRGKNGLAVASEPEVLRPTAPPRETALSGIKEGDEIEVRDGRLFVNNREIPVLTKEDLNSAKLNVDELTIPQEQ